MPNSKSISQKKVSLLRYFTVFFARNHLQTPVTTKKLSNIAPSDDDYNYDADACISENEKDPKFDEGIDP
jgi:hypothetical protein